MNIQILVFSGFDELDVIGVYEPLKMAGFNVSLCTLAQSILVKSAHGLAIESQGILSLENKPDLLIVPGGGWLNRSEVGAWAEAKKPALLNLLSDFHQCKVIMTSVCAGAMLLGKAGILSKRNATTHSGAMQELESLGVNVIKARIVDDGDIITAGGVTSSLDLALWLIQRFAGAEQAKEIARRLEFDLREPIWQKEKS